MIILTLNLFQLSYPQITHLLFVDMKLDLKVLKMVKLKWLH